MVLSGARLSGERSEQIINAAEQIIDRYEDFYKKEGA
jgi:hypothetical protein